MTGNVSKTTRPAEVIWACSDRRLNPLVKRAIDANNQMEIDTVPIRMPPNSKLAKRLIRNVISTRPVISVRAITHEDCKYREARFELSTSAGSFEQFENRDNDGLLVGLKAMVFSTGKKCEVGLEHARLPEMENSSLIAPAVLEVAYPDSRLYVRDEGLQGKFMLSINNMRVLDQNERNTIKFFLERGMVSRVDFIMISEGHKPQVKVGIDRLVLAAMIEKPHLAIGVGLRQEFSV